MSTKNFRPYKVSCSNYGSDDFPQNFKISFYLLSLHKNFTQEKFFVVLVPHYTEREQRLKRYFYVKIMELLRLLENF